MKPPASRRPRPADWRRWLPSPGAASKALALAATLAFVTVVGLRAGPAASAPAVPALPSAAAAPAPSAPRPPEAPAAARAPEAPVAPPASGAAASVPSAAGGADATGGAAPARGEEAGAGVLPDGRVVLNVASEQELTRLPGIGPTRAKAILALRSRLGRFRSLTDLRRVKGIGRRSLERLRAHAVLDAPG